MNDLPRYDDLEQIEKLGIRTSWGVLPTSLGTIALQHPDAVAAAARAVQTGEVIALGVATDAFDPPLFGRTMVRNELVETSRNIFEDDIVGFNPQSTSQWDGLPHIRAREYGFYSGITDLEQARRELGIQHWAARGIVGRGVIVDVERHFRSWGRNWDPLLEDTVQPEDIERMLAADGVSLERGDVLLLRFGWLGAHRGRVAAGEDIGDAGARFAGLASHERTARFLWDAGVAAIGVDNPAVESAPGNPVDGSLHRRLIPGLGFALAELLDLDRLAQRTAEIGRTTFLFVAAPCPVAGAVSSTANALAII